MLQTHPAYQRIKIIVPEKPVRKIYFSPSHLGVTKTNGTIIASGQLAENEILSFEVILEKDTIKTLSGFSIYTENVTTETEAANIKTGVTQSEPVITQPPPQSLSGNWFIDWFNNLLHQITNPFQQSPPVPTYQSGIYRVPTVAPLLQTHYCAEIQLSTRLHAIYSTNEEILEKTR